MQAEIVRHALDRVPLSLIIDDATLLVNLNYFFIRDRNLATGADRRWEDVPVAHPEAFTRTFAEWCLEQGVCGKFSVVPCPAGLGCIDRGLPLFSRAQQESWLAMAREVIRPAFDITPEMLSHTFVLDLETFQPLPSRIWEQYEWETLPAGEAERVRDYIAAACRILANVGLPPEGVTSPGGFGGRTLALYARVAGEALREVTGNATPYFFKRVEARGRVETYVWEQDPARGTAVGEVVAGTADRTGSWTGYDPVDADYYIGDDLCSGRLPELIRAGDPAIMCSHWQGFYGLHADDQRGFKTLKTVVARLRQADPHGERTRWHRPSEIATYACARAMASLRVAEDGAILMDLPVRAPEMTLRLSGVARLRGVSVGETPLGLLGEVPLKRVESRRDFQSGTYLVEGDEALVAFDPPARQVSLRVDLGE